MSADSALELAKLLIDHPDIAQAMKGMAVVHNTYNGPTTVYIGCSFGGNGGGGGNKSPSSKGRKGRGRPTVTLDTSVEDEEVAQEEDEEAEEDTSTAPAPAPTVSVPAPAEAPQMGYQEASKIYARLDGLSGEGQISEEVPSINTLKVAHPDWMQAFSVADDQVEGVIRAFNADPSSRPSPAPF